MPVAIERRHMSRERRIMGRVRAKTQVRVFPVVLSPSVLSTRSADGQRVQSHLNTIREPLSTAFKTAFGLGHYPSVACCRSVLK